MEHSHTQIICCALLKSKGTRCTCRSQKGHEFCGKHLKSKNIIRYDSINNNQNIPGNSPIIHNKIIKEEAILIPIHYRSRIRYNTVKVRDLDKTLNYYRQPTDGNKKCLFDRLLVYFDSLLPYISGTSNILTIQTWFRKHISKKILQLRILFNYNISECVNDTDVLTLDPLSSLSSSYLFTYKDIDNFIYGFDIRSFNKLLEEGSENPYTGKKIQTFIIKCAKELIHYLVINGLNLEINDNNDCEENSKYLIKRRVVKVFQEMDNLDQYTNPSWFLDLNINSLIKFYKEAEDIWNYRLNLTKEIQHKIYPPDGKVFKIEPKNILKEYNNKDALRTVCLDVIERLIYSAPDRSDRVNGCIYVLLAFVIVNAEAAQAMPSYYTMVTGDVINANYLEIPI